MGVAEISGEPSPAYFRCDYDIKTVESEFLSKKNRKPGGLLLALPVLEYAGAEREQQGRRNISGEISIVSFAPRANFE